MRTPYWSPFGYNVSHQLLYLAHLSNIARSRCNHACRRGEVNDFECAHWSNYFGFFDTTLARWCLKKAREDIKWVPVLSPSVSLMPQPTWASLLSTSIPLWLQCAVFRWLLRADDSVQSGFLNMTHRFTIEDPILNPIQHHLGELEQETQILDVAAYKMYLLFCSGCCFHIWLITRMTE